MQNFDPTKHDNATNPYMLSVEKQQQVVDTVDDSRLANPSGDYFRLELENRSVDIPKLEVISRKTEDGRIVAVNTTVYIKKLLENDE